MSGGAGAPVRVVLLSGPSCVGKGPLLAAAARFSGLSWRRLPVIKSKESRPRGPRPDEHAVWEDPSCFRPRAEIEDLRGQAGFVVGTCQGLPQALDLRAVLAGEGDLFVGEAYHALVHALLESRLLAGRDLRTLFLSPLGAGDRAFLRQAAIDEPAYVRALMTGKLTVRAQFQGVTVDAADVGRRAGDAPEELVAAARYHAVLPNPCGEGDPRWRRLPSGDFLGPPVGAAAEVLASFVAELRGQSGALCEPW